MLEEFSDPRLAALYDTTCGWGPDHTFYLELAQRLSASAVVDIGCGTGMLAVAIAELGLTTIGVEPAAPMLAIARERAGGASVEWILGDAPALDTALDATVDLVVMSAHVAQLITDDDAWTDTLLAARRVLRAGGHVAFESRPPWIQHELAERQDWIGEFVAPGVGAFALSVVAVATVDDLERYELHYRFADGETIVSTNELRYRSQADLEQQLRESGFEVSAVYGDWDSGPVTGDSKELIFVAQAIERDALR